MAVTRNTLRLHAVHAIAVNLRSSVHAYYGGTVHVAGNNANLTQNGPAHTIAGVFIGNKDVSAGHVAFSEGNITVANNSLTVTIAADRSLLDLWDSIPGCDAPIYIDRVAGFGLYAPRIIVDSNTFALHYDADSIATLSADAGVVERLTHALPDREMHEDHCGEFDPTSNDAFMPFQSDFTGRGEINPAARERCFLPEKFGDIVFIATASEYGATNERWDLTGGGRGHECRIYDAIGFPVMNPGDCIVSTDPYETSQFEGVPFNPNDFSYMQELDEAEGDEGTPSVNGSITANPMLVDEMRDPFVRTGRSYVILGSSLSASRNTINIGPLASSAAYGGDSSDWRRLMLPESYPNTSAVTASNGTLFIPGLIFVRGVAISFGRQTGELDTNVQTMERARVEVGTTAFTDTDTLLENIGAAGLNTMAEAEARWAGREDCSALVVDGNLFAYTGGYWSIDTVSVHGVQTASAATLLVTNNPNVVKGMRRGMWETYNTEFYWVFTHSHIGGWLFAMPRHQSTVVISGNTLTIDNTFNPQADGDEINAAFALFRATLARRGPSRYVC